MQESMKFIVVFYILFIASYTDIKFQKIPNPLIVIGLVQAVFFMESWRNLGEYAVVLFLLFLLGLSQILGAGDVKLWMVIAGFFGGLSSLYIFVISQLLLFAFVLITAPYKFGIALYSPANFLAWFRRRKTNGNIYPLAPFLLLAAIIFSLGGGMS